MANNLFIDKCNQCSKPIEIDMDTMLFTASCSCKSEIKEAIYGDRLRGLDIERETRELFQPMLADIEATDRHYKGVKGFFNLLFGVKPPVPRCK